MRSSYRSVLEQIFHEDCPPAWQIGMLRVLNTAYELTREYCRPPQFGPAEARDLRGHHIRAKFEAEWRRLASDFPEVVAESRPNIKNSYNHTWVKVGRLFLTASSVQKKSQKPRSAEFRSDYAENGQLSLLEKPIPVDEATVYAVFRYGALQAEYPSIAVVSFPSKNWTTYTEHINLAALYPGIIQAPVLATTEMQEEPMPTDIRVTPEEEIKEPEIPDLRRRRKTAGEEEG